mgnify:CR=1
MSTLCNYCHMKVDASEVKVGDKSFHPECFVCMNCKKSLLGESFRMKEVPFCGKVHSV